MDKDGTQAQLDALRRSYEASTARWDALPRVEAAYTLAGACLESIELFQPLLNGCKIYPQWLEDNPVSADRLVALIWPNGLPKGETVAGQIKELTAAGMPSVGNGRARKFDPEIISRWMDEVGRFGADDGPKIALFASALEQRLVLLARNLNGEVAWNSQVHAASVNASGCTASSWIELVFVVSRNWFTAILRGSSLPAAVDWIKSGPRTGCLQPFEVVRNWPAVKAGLLGLPAVDCSLLKAQLAIEFKGVCAAGVESQVPRTSPRSVGSRLSVVIHGKTLAVKTKAQEGVLRALIEAFPGGLTKDELVQQSGYEDAVNVLKRLRSKPTFSSLIELRGPSHARGGYAICGPK